MTGAVAALFLFATSAFAEGPEHTTHRVGDRILYMMGCHNEDVVIALGEAGGDPALMAELLTKEYVRSQCFRMARPLGATLVRWIDGHFKTDREGVTGSAWEVLDQLGATEYILLYDSGGDHPALKLSAA